MTSVDGLVTGIDTTSIIEGLLGVQQRQIEQFEVRKARALQQQAVVRTLDAQLTNFQSLAGRLSRAADNPLVSKVASVSNESALIATASSSAVAGTYAVRIDSVAQAHQVATQGFESAGGAITHGTIDIQVGSRPAETITIDVTNDTLQGLADAINAGVSGVSATIVQDATGGAAPYRLLLTADEPGTGNAIAVTNNLSAATGGAERPAFDFAQPVQAARDASLTLGSGPGAITVSSATNEFRNVIAGVTLTALQEDAGKTITVRVAADVEAATAAVEDFVAGFNEVVDLIAQQTAYDPQTDQSGLLTGNRIVSDVRNALLETALGVVPGVDQQFNRLSALGISVQNDGRLQLDSARLSDVLSGGVTGAAATDVGRLFALNGQSNHPGIRFLLGSSRTLPSSTAYEVDISRAAEQAVLVGSQAVAASTVISAGQDELHLQLDGVSLEVGLKYGSYTREELVDELEQAVNSHPDLANRRLTVEVDGSGVLSLTSHSFGSASRVQIEGGDAIGLLGLSVGQSAVGVDVAGRFLVDGKEEIAVGTGRILTGDPDNVHTADLRVQVELASNQISAGVEGELTVTEGIAARLTRLVGDLLESDGGRVQNLADQFESTASTLDETIARYQSTAELQRESLLRQFAAMEAAISELQSTASFLGGQLSTLNSFAPT